MSTEEHIPEELLSPYDPGANEQTIYDQWLSSNLFDPDTLVKEGFVDPSAPHFSIVLPPPNVTGVLHTGHALTVALEDAMVRYKRLQGYRALWVPGTDHAAIATQSKVEKLLEKEGVKKRDLSRDEFLDRVHQYAMESQSTIKDQLRRMGCSLDWSREAFTLDEKREKAVHTAFKRMFDDELIYRGHRIVNWDPKGRTAVSDEEVEHEEREATLYTFRYSSDFPIPISTTRPETKVGDTAVAVHPDDTRYAKYIGKEFDLEFCGVPLHVTVVGDEAVDPEYGTGALGVTPAHSATDWEIAQRHGLSAPQIIDERARMLVGDENIKDKKTDEAREEIVARLREAGLIEEEESVKQNVGVAQRSGGIIEPLPKLQWFIDVNKEFTLPQSNIPGIKSGQKVNLKQLMRAAVDSGEVRFIPERFNKTYFHWIDNLHDWCISRQIWYGHRIPVWYKGGVEEETEVHVGSERPEGDGWEQDPDTLDTWFSSGLWTFSTLGWPDTTEDMNLYHPTSMLETGHDILFFWVSRMILMSTYLLHGMVRDEKGLKMSKSLGNAMDPVDQVEKNGTDALRMALVVGNTPGTDLSLSEDQIKAYKHFANKIWNATRFVLSNTASEFRENEPDELTKRDKEHYADFQKIMQKATSELDAYQLHLASETLYNYFWHTYADIIIEESKKVPDDDREAQHSKQWLLYYILKNSLILLHPFMPFVTEKIWGLLPDTENLLMVQAWPKRSKTKKTLRVTLKVDRQ